MLFRKSEPKRWRPTMAITVGALTVVGAITVTNALKSAACKIKSKMSSMLGGMSHCETPDVCECDEDQY